MTTNTENTMHSEETLRSIEAELLELETEIGRQRLIREKATYKLERLVREQDRVARHLASVRTDGAA
jgi:hypothetical protein